MYAHLHSTEQHSAATPRAIRWFIITLDQPRISIITILTESDRSLDDSKAASERTCEKVSAAAEYLYMARWHWKPRDGCIFHFGNAVLVQLWGWRFVCVSPDKWYEIPKARRTPELFATNKFDYDKIVCTHNCVIKMWKTEWQAAREKETHAPSAKMCATRQHQVYCVKGMSLQRVTLNTFVPF